MVMYLRQLALLFTVIAVHGNEIIPDLQMDQPVRVQPGPSYLGTSDYNSKVRDYAARALEILTIRARVKKRKSRYRTRSFKAATCDDRYEEVSATHTMCQRDVGKGKRLSQAIKDAIVSQHNVYRSRVSPTASNMQKMVWDDSLAVVAAKWSRQCRRGHDKGPNRASPDLPGLHVGQNAAYGYRNWQTAIEAWHNEVSDFQYGKGSLGDAVVGHYTQIVAWRSARLGCGQADCPDSPYKRHYVCNYAVGQMNDDPQTPYREGDRCADCPNQCDESGNLCDCDGKVCLNGGKINLLTCQCKCPNIYSGEVCQTLQCPEEDPWYCGSQWPEDYCQQFINVPLECPHMCEICEKDSAQDSNTAEPDRCKLQCKNGGKVDVTKCTCSCPEGFGGRRCERKARLCDGKTCVNGGQLNTQTCQCACPMAYTGERCETTLQVCDGKSCQNRGRLNTATCECQCPDGFGGSECQTSLPVCPAVVCENGGRRDELTCGCKCPDEFTGKRCHKQKCANVKCHYGGKINYTDCSCVCQAVYEGTRCKKKVTAYSTNTVCEKTCQNGGLLDPVHCRCLCPSPFTGVFCEEVDCPEEDKEVCEHLLPSYCTDHFLMRHLCPFKCELCARKACDPDQWFCNENNIKPHLCSFVGKYCPKFCGLC